MTLRIIEYKTEASGKPVLEVAVFQDAAGAVLATVTLNHRQTYNTIDEVPAALPAREAFLVAVGVAEREAIPFVWVNDPHDLFPPEVRRVRQVEL